MEHQLEIEVIYRGSNIFNRLNHGLPIQTKPFELGLSFKNRGNNPLLGATINSIKWGPASEQRVISTINKSFHLDTLNPGEKRKMWIDKTGTYAHGLCQINLNILADNNVDTIRTFQVNTFTKEVDIFLVNSWTDFFFIRSKSEYTQSWSNSLLIWVAVLSAFVSVLSLIALRQQTDYVAVQSLSDRIVQAQSLQNAIKFCKTNPTSQESGLYDVTDGSQASCKNVLQQYGK